MSRSRRKPSYGHCPEGRRCNFCGPETGARRRDKRQAPEPDEYELEPLTEPEPVLE